MPENTPQQKNIWFLIIPFISGIFFIIDRLTKEFFISNSDLLINILPKWLWLHFQLNTQMALSLPMFPSIYYFLTTVISIGLVFQLVKVYRKKQILEYALILFILCGAISNLLDRLYFGGVIDFININLGSIFNLADCFIVVAVIIWIGRIIYYDRRKKVSTAR